VGKLPLSVVVITKNEENNIADCLKSVAGWADEIIVIDDESRDRTVEIAKSYADKVLHRRMDNEGTHRNWAYGQARNEWVLSLDADEIVSAELREEIAGIFFIFPLPSAKGGSASGGNPPHKGEGIIKLNSSPRSGGGKVGGVDNQFHAFSIPLRNYIGNYWVQHSGWYPAGKLRLFMKSRFKYEEVPVHPKVFLDGNTGHLTKDIIHKGYPDFEHFLASLNRQTTLEAVKWIQTGRQMSLGRAVWRTIDRFPRVYFGKKGYKDGFIGFMIAFLASLYQVMSYAKYWEMKRNQREGIR